MENEPGDLDKGRRQRPVDEDLLRIVDNLADSVIAGRVGSAVLVSLSADNQLVVNWSRGTDVYRVLGMLQIGGIMVHQKICAGH